MRVTDRFMREADAIRVEVIASPWVDQCPNALCTAMAFRCAKLLRRQHAAYVRMARRIGDTVEAGASGTSAINTVLAALEKYRQGTR